jgi:hypothetical protein
LQFLVAFLENKRQVWQKKLSNVKKTYKCSFAQSNRTRTDFLTECPFLHVDSGTGWPDEFVKKIAQNVAKTIFVVINA